MIPPPPQLCPQAYTSMRPTLTGLHAMRTMCIICLLIIPQVVIFFNATRILLALGQEPRVAELAGQYLRVLSTGLPGYAVFEVVRRWLQSQGLMKPPTAVVTVIAPVNVLLNYLLVWLPPPVGRGFIGAPLASAISMDLMGFLLVVYSIIWAPKDAWPGFTKDAFRNWNVNISLGISGVLMSASEWWSWEIAALAASLLSPVALASQSVLLITASIFYQTAFASSSAAAVRMGNLLGAGMPARARLAARVAVVYGIGLGVLNLIVLLVNKKHWGSLFSNDPDVVSLVSQIVSTSHHRHSRPFTDCFLQASTCRSVPNFRLWHWIGRRSDERLWPIWTGRCVLLSQIFAQSESALADIDSYNSCH